MSNIEEAVIVGASAINERFTNFTELFPILALDRSWTSTANLDYFLMHLRGAKNIPLEEEELLFEAACYLGSLAYNSTSQLPEVKASCYVEKESRDVMFEVSCSLTKESRKGVLTNISQLIKSSLLAKSGEKAPVIGDYKRKVKDQELQICFTSLGLRIGPCPFGKGEWGHISVDAVEPFIKKVIPIAASETAIHYENCFPEEQIGQQAVVYLSALLYPPCHFRERFPGLRAFSFTEKFLEQAEIEPKFRKNFYFNLAQISDPTLAIAGYLGSTIAAERDEILLLSQLNNKFSHYGSLLHGSLAIAGKSRSIDLDFYTLMKKGELNKAYASLKHLLKLNLLPMLALDHSYLDVTELQEFWEAILRHDPRELANLIPEQLANLDPTVAMQKALLILFSGDIDQTEKNLKKIERRYPSNVLDNSALYAELKGGFLAKTDSPEGAIILLQQFLPSDESLAGHAEKNIAMLFSHILFQLEEYEKIEEMFQVLPHNCQMNLDINLTRIKALLRLGEKEKARNNALALGAFSITEPRVFVLCKDLV